MKRVLTVMAAACALALAVAGQSGVGAKLVVGRAATLAAPFDQVARSLPRWRCEQQSGGSRFLLREMTDLGRPMDVLAVADAGLFAAATGPRAPRWWVEFATNQLVLAYTPRSRQASRVNSSNWMDVLLGRYGPVSFGYADPNLDPEGYNTLIAWKLAARYYHRPGLYARLKAAAPLSNLRQHSVALLALLEAGQLDYAWEYLSLARQHGLRRVALPAAINLGDPSLASGYASASVSVAGARPGETTREIGRPIIYGATIPITAENAAGGLAFLRRLVSPAGQAALRAADQPPLVPACVAGDPAAAFSAARAWLARLPRCRS